MRTRLPRPRAAVVGALLLSLLGAASPTPATAAAASAPAPGAAATTASQLLQQLPVAAENTVPGFVPVLFLQDGTRPTASSCGAPHDVRVAEALVSRPVLSDDGCDIDGTWRSAWDDTEVSSGQEVSVHHVPLAEAWRSGASTWTAQQQRDHAEDLAFAASLLVVSRAVDAARADRDPGSWLPPATGARCEYAASWVQVKHRWNLSVDPREQAALAGVLAGCGDPVVAPPPAGTAAPFSVTAQPRDGVLKGQTLASGRSITSPNGRYSLVMQQDGNLVAHAPGGRVLWHSRTWGHPGASMSVQYDGNLVVYATSGRALWHSGTYRYPTPSDVPYVYLRLQDDGNAVLYREGGPALWWSGWDRTGLTVGQGLVRGQQLTSANGRYHAVLQADGNLVVYGPGSRPLWFNGAYGSDRLQLERNNNLVTWWSSVVTWQTSGFQDPGARAVVQDDGNLVLYRSDGRAFWYSGWDVGQTATSPSGGTRVDSTQRR